MKRFPTPALDFDLPKLNDKQPQSQTEAKWITSITGVPVQTSGNSRHHTVHKIQVCSTQREIRQDSTPPQQREKLGHNA
jgi:hypothetical protein